MVSFEKDNRCSWAGEKPIYIKYHDEEWGVPVHNDQKFFEFLCLEGQQAGLSWITVLNKRESYKRLFYNFNVLKVSKMSDSEIENLLQDKSIIRNRLKLYSIRNNAVFFLKIQKEYGSFNDYIWSFVNGKTIHSNALNINEIQTKNEISDKMSKDLKQKGFKFIGTTICYAFMQATGLVNDHVKTCFRYNEVKNLE